jgi:hypothetical protein
LIVLSIVAIIFGAITILGRILIVLSIVAIIFGAITMLGRILIVLSIVAIIFGAITMLRRLVIILPIVAIIFGVMLTPGWSRWFGTVFVIVVFSICAVSSFDRSSCKTHPSDYEDYSYQK